MDQQLLFTEASMGLSIESGKDGKKSMPVTLSTLSIGIIIDLNEVSP